MKSALASTLILIATVMVGVEAFGSTAAVVKASEIQEFHLLDCRGDTCMDVKADEAQVSRTLTNLSARDARLKIKGETVSCARLRYDFKTQLTICDNRDLGRDSLVITSEFVVNRFTK